MLATTILAQGQGRPAEETRENRDYSSQFIVLNIDTDTQEEGIRASAFGWARSHSIE